MKITTQRKETEPSAASNTSGDKRQANMVAAAPRTEVAPKINTRSPEATTRVVAELQQRRDAPLSTDALKQTTRDAVRATPTVDSVLKENAPEVTPVVESAEPAAATAATEPTVEAPTTADPMVAAIREGARTPLDELETELTGDALTDVSPMTNNETHVAASDATPALDAEESALDKRAG